MEALVLVFWRAILKLELVLVGRVQLGEGWGSVLVLKVLWGNGTIEWGLLVGVVQGLVGPVELAAV